MSGTGQKVFIFGPNLKTKTLLRPRPKLNNSYILIKLDEEKVCPKRKLMKILPNVVEKIDALNSCTLFQLKLFKEMVSH